MEYEQYWQNLENEFDVEQFLREEQENEKQRLEQELSRIEELLSDRDEIHSDTVNELESKLNWYLERLEQHYTRPGTSKKEKQRLKNKVQEFYTEIRSEKRKQWLDKSELEQERRQVLKELDELNEESLSDLF